MGFIKNRSSTDNMRRLLHLMWMNQSNLDPIAAISLDAEKTFNGVEWEFLFVTWDKFGFGPGFVKWVKILYSNPKATVISNAITSSFFFFLIYLDLPIKVVLLIHYSLYWFWNHLLQRLVKTRDLKVYLQGKENTNCCYMLMTYCY